MMQSQTHKKQMQHNSIYYELYTLCNIIKGQQIYVASISMLETSTIILKIL